MKDYKNHWSRVHLAKSQPEYKVLHCLADDSIYWFDSATVAKYTDLCETVVSDAFLYLELNQLLESLEFAKVLHYRITAHGIKQYKKFRADNGII